METGYFFNKCITKFNLGLALMSLLMLGCKESEEVGPTEIVLTNQSDMQLTDKAVSIEKELWGDDDNRKKSPLVISGTDTIPAQLNDLDGDGEWDEIFLVTDFSAQEEKIFQLEWTDESPDYEVRTSVRFGKREAADEPVKPATEETLIATDMPEALGFKKYQTDGPTWENDKIGFRHYLDGRNAKDIFGKKSASISPEDVGINDQGEVEDDYHQMEDWGRDIFPVGNSVGLGGIALLVDDEVKRMGVTVEDTLNNIEETTFRIVSEGPVKSVLQYEYEGWEASGNNYTVEETTVIWPGMYGFKNTVKVDGLTGNETLLVGLSNINNENPLEEIEIGDWVALIAHDYQTYEREWLLGTAIVLPKDIYEGYIEAPEEGDLTDSFLAKIEVENNSPVSYYALAGWEESPDKYFDDPVSFKDYVINQVKQISAEIDVEINN